MLLTRFLAVLLPLTGSALFLGRVLLPASPAPRVVVSLATLETQLDRAPAAWAGRIFWVRAVVAPCAWWSRRARLEECVGTPLLLVNGPGAFPAAPMPLDLPEPPPMVAALRAAPLLDTLLSPLLPAMPLPAWGREATYLIRLQSIAPGTRDAPHHAAALLLSAPS